MFYWYEQLIVALLFTPILYFIKVLYHPASFKEKEMTQFEHTFIFVTIYAILWNLFIKQYFYGEEEHRGIMKFWYRNILLIRYFWVIKFF